MKKINFALALSLITSATLAQGPIDGYSKGKNNLDVGFGYTLEKGNDFYAGKKLAGFSRDIESYNLFAIYGITNRLDVQVSTPYIINGNEKNFQDGSIYLKYKAISSQRSFGTLEVFPAIGFYQPLSNYQTEGLNALGQDNNSFDMRLVVQQNIKNGLFVAVQGGYLIKTDPTPNAYSTSLKVGFAKGRFYTDAWFESYQAIGGTDYRGVDDKAPTAERGGFRGLGFGYTKVGLTGYYTIINKLGAYVGLASTLSGRNADKSNRISLGIVIKPFN